MNKSTEPAEIINDGQNRDNIQDTDNIQNTDNRENTDNKQDTDNTQNIIIKVEEEQNIIIEEKKEKTPFDERLEYFLNVITFFKELAPFLNYIDSFPYWRDLEKYKQGMSNNDISATFEDNPKMLVHKIEQLISKEPLSNNEELFQAIKSLHTLLKDQQTSLNRFITALKNNVEKIKRDATSKEHLNAHLSVFLSVKFAVEQRASVISNFSKEISLLYIELEKIVSPKTPLNNEQLSKEVNDLLSKAAREAGETLNNRLLLSYSKIRQNRLSSAKGRHAVSDIDPLFA